MFQKRNDAIVPKSGAARTLDGISPATLAFLNATVELCSPRIYFGIDATKSRAHTWRLAKKMQGELAKSLVKADELPSQLRVAYFNGSRNFDATLWTQDSAYIQNWMDRITCITGETQLLRLLDDVRNEIARGPRVSSVIYIGDCFEEAAEEAYAKALAIGQTTPIHIMHEVGDVEMLDDKELVARRAFRGIASRSGGRYTCFSHGDYEAFRDQAKVLVAYAYGRDSKFLEALRKDKGLNSTARKLLGNGQG